MSRVDGWADDWTEHRHNPGRRRKEHPRAQLLHKYCWTDSSVCECTLYSVKLFQKNSVNKRVWRQEPSRRRELRWRRPAVVVEHRFVVVVDVSRLLIVTKVNSSRTQKFVGSHNVCKVCTLFKLTPGQRVLKMIKIRNDLVSIADVYEIGDKFNARCHSVWSVLEAHLSIRINNMDVSRDALLQSTSVVDRYTPEPNSPKLFETIYDLSFIIHEKHVRKGYMNISCLSTIKGLNGLEDSQLLETKRIRFVGNYVSIFEVVW